MGLRDLVMLLFCVFTIPFFTLHLLFAFSLAAEHRADAFSDAATTTPSSLG